MTPPSRATAEGRAYLDLRKKAREDRRPVDELMQLYILESFLARLAATRFVERLVLKGGVLLPAFGERRPTRDIDLQAQAFDNDRRPSAWRSSRSPLSTSTMGSSSMWSQQPPR